MGIGVFNKVIEEARGFIKHCYLSNWGEPSLNKKLPEMIRKTKEFATVDIATHGLFLDEPMAEAMAEADTLSVSIDGIDQETYEKYRVGGKVDEAFRGLRLLIEKCAHKVNWTYVVFKDNEHQIPAAQKLADEFGANIGFKPPLFWDRSRMDAQMPTDDKYRRYQRVNGEWVLKSDPLKCREFWQTIYILPSGDVLTCCYDGNAEWPMGNVKQDSVLDVWNGAEYQKARAQHLSGTLNKTCASYCQLPG